MTVSSRQPDHAPSVMSTDSQTGPYAIVETSGTQVWVQPNRYYDLNRIHAEVDSTLDKAWKLREEGEDIPLLAQAIEQECLDCVIRVAADHAEEEIVQSRVAGVVRLPCSR